MSSDPSDPTATTHPTTSNSADEPQPQREGASSTPASSTPESSTPESSTPESSTPDAPGSESAQASEAEREAAGQDAVTGAESAPAAEASAPADKPRFKIQIGSRRGDGAEQITSSTPVTAAPTEPPKPLAASGKKPPAAPPAEKPQRREPVPPPSRREALSPELQRELDAALGDVSIDELISTPVAAEASQEIEMDTRRPSTVVRVHGENVFFSLDGRNEGVASLRQFAEPPSPGDQLEVVVRGFNAEEGFYEVSVPGQSIDVADWDDLTEGAVVEARITGANTGGLECMVNNIRGFIPASQVAMFRVEDFADYVGQRLLCVATEVNPRRKNLVLSHRAVLEREKEEAKRKLIEELEPGQVREGVVRNVRDFGVFVDLGGLDGLIHVSQLSWERVKHPSEVLSEGQKVKVKVEKINPETGKISLSYRDLLEHPWDGVEGRFPLGSIHKGPVTRTAKFGAFVRLAPGIEGLIHISELAHHRIRRVEDIVKEGDEIEVKVMSVDREAQRIGLSLKATQEAPEAAAESVDTADEPPPQPVIRPRNQPLKGGVDRPSGGDNFGLNW